VSSDRIYRAGDLEPHDEPVLLLETGTVAQRIGSLWWHGHQRLEWAELLLGDMVAVGVALPVHPDRLAKHPVDLITPPADPGGGVS
jgi:hypothetical protein